MEERFKNFTVLISNINRCIRRIKTAEMAELDLKSPHVSCLYYLYKEDSLTAKELCDICEEDKAAVSRSIDFLENNGYIEKSNAQKKYRTPLVLTEKGKLTGKLIADKIDNVLNEAGLDMNEEERTVFYRNLALISTNLQKICEKYK